MTNYLLEPIIINAMHCLKMLRKSAASYIVNEDENENIYLHLKMLRKTTGSLIVNDNENGKKLIYNDHQ